MKRLKSSVSFDALTFIYPATEEHSPRNNHAYSREFQSMLDGLDEEGYMEKSGHVPEKKRRLNVEQVEALEENFEVENKLEPERKVKLAQELGLQPRQVAVWFQNRRARWKTKQLEREYGLLQSNYNSLKENFDSLQQENEALLKQIRELKSKLNDENCTESNLSIKEEEALVSESHAAGSSAILNEDSSPNAAAGNTSPSGGDGIFLHNNHQLLISSSSSPTPSSLGLNCSSSSSPLSITYFNLLESSAGNTYHTQFVKMEEHDFFDEEACNFFSEDQAPSLHCYCPDQWT